MTTRQGREPSTLWLRDLLLALQELYPGIALGRDVMTQLRPWWLKAHQAGENPRRTALMTCACDGKRIVPNPQLHGLTFTRRPPKGARPGDVFGVEDLRPPAALARLERRRDMLLSKLYRASNARGAALETIQRGRSAAQRARAQAALPALVAKQQLLESELNQIREQIQAENVPRQLRPKAAPKPRAPRRARCGSSPACSLGLMGGTCGVPGPLLTSSATGTVDEQTARYCLIDAFKVITSHDPLKGFSPRPQYPAAVQERRYDADRNEQLKVLQIAQALRPELIYSDTPGAIDGMPVVTEDGIALGGNGRSMAIQLAYADGNKALPEYLRKHAKKFGLARADVESIAHPTIVRVIQAPKDARQLAQIVRVLNLPLTGGIDARGLSVAQSRTLDPSALTTIAMNLSDDVSLSDYLEASASRSLVDALRKSQIINPRNANTLLDPDGLLNRAGRGLVQEILLASLVQDAAILERLGDAVIGSLTRSAPFWLVAGVYNAGFDVRAAMLSAARDLSRARITRARSVEQYLSQGALMQGERIQSEADPLALALLRILFGVGTAPLKLTRIAQLYAQAARRAGSDAQGGLFFVEPVTPLQALRNAAADVGLTL